MTTKRFSSNFSRQRGSWVWDASLHLGRRNILLIIGVKDYTNRDYLELLSVMSWRTWEAKIGTKRVSCRIFTMHRVA